MSVLSTELLDLSEEATASARCLMVVTALLVELMSLHTVNSSD